MLLTENLETPCIIADYAKVKTNIKNMQEICFKYNCNLRPHIKTHKSVEIARLQIEAGAVGITCAKISEAEVMADGGISDIFIAYPLVGLAKIERAVKLARSVKRLILAADSLYCAKALSDEAVKNNLTLEVRLEIDTGAKRTGANMDDVVSLGTAVSKLPGLNLSGLYTFKGMVYEGKPTTDFNEAAKEEAELLNETAKKLSAENIQIKDISAGSTPTGPACAATGLVNEIRPGTYVFYDQSCLAQGACKESDIAAKIIATVVSVADQYAVIDGGSKTFPMDTALNRPPYQFHSYAYIKGRGDLILDRLNEEHGMVRTADGSHTDLKIGELLELTPTHICPAINLQNHIFLNENGILRKLNIDARGMVV